VDGGKTVLDICRERNIAEQTFDRWKRVFGMMEVSEARRLKELERENTKLKKMFAEELLRNRVLSYVCEKKAVSPAARRAYAQEVVSAKVCSQRQACQFLRLARSTFRYRGRPPRPAAEQLWKRLLALSEEPAE
jgi:putative transposase